MRYDISYYLIRSFILHSFHDSWGINKKLFPQKFDQSIHGVAPQ